ncbi:protein AGENET DOMAIN (AGD)-CONTAINING P1-like [Rhodamnia argentea]|uniref:Protein AGENET DOMAIN (AGD)-CONTAINING P1-like n=1 Tax=Rhodamnia argentea TaxID=178133 RepID=A0A8B8MYI8_9MYRT|nr:protein AGENET DOMAIN (AGD)-CONTAINING P1-like [Rhodamnia argentea]
MAHPRFGAGAEVEIMSPIQCLRGTLFPGRVVAPSPRNPHAFLVEYKTLIAQGDAGRPSRPYREEVSVGLLRPNPPAETSRSFHLDDVVDAFFNGGWSEGVITKELKNSRFMVYFRCVKQQYRFDAAELRLHREWVNGNWVPPFEAEEEDGDGNNDKEATSIVEKKSGGICQTVKGVFAKGALVEVRSDEDGLQGSWFAATIINKAARNQFFIEYQTLRAEDSSSEYLREQVVSSCLRPYPPETIVVDPYEQNASVDALYNEGWWEGIVERPLAGMWYQVYFKGTRDRMEFHHSELRPHQDWVNGKWVMPSRVSEDQLVPLHIV